MSKIESVLLPPQYTPNVRIKQNIQPQKINLANKPDEFISKVKKHPKRYIFLALSAIALVAGFASYIKKSGILIDMKGNSIQKKGDKIFKKSDELCRQGEKEYNEVMSVMNKFKNADYENSENIKLRFIENKKMILEELNNNKIERRSEFKFDKQTKRFKLANIAKNYAEKDNLGRATQEFNYRNAKLYSVLQDCKENANGKLNTREIYEFRNGKLIAYTNHIVQSYNGNWKAKEIYNFQNENVVSWAQRYKSKDGHIEDFKTIQFKERKVCWYKSNNSIYERNNFGFVKIIPETDNIPSYKIKNTDINSKLVA